MDNEKRAIELIEMASEMSERYYKKPIVCTYSGGKDSDVLVDKQLEEVEKVKSLFHTPTVQYQTAVVPQMRGDKVTGYKVEYSAMVAVEAKPLFREA